MAALARSLSTRVSRIEKPKPLKNIVSNRHSFSDKEYAHPSPEPLELKTTDVPTRGGAEEVLMVLDIVSSCILNKDYCNITPLTNNLTHSFRSYGSQLEEYNKERLDKIFDIIRNGAHDICIDRQGRLNLLHLIEIRASLYQLSPGAAAYYAINSGLHHELGEVYGDSGLDTSQQQLLGPGDVLKSSGKYSSPTRVPGKNYCKDEVVIRNSDSGKVMGIKGRRVHMIEELSETVISFQRVNPGAKERLVQITGPSEDKIVYAKNLIEDTIKRNASPVRELGMGIGGYQEAAGSNSSINSSASDESNRLHNLSGGAAGKEGPEYKYSVHIQNEVIHISSTNLNLLNEAFSFLDSSYSTLEESPAVPQTLSPTKVIQSVTFTPQKTELPSPIPISSSLPSSDETGHNESDVKETPDAQEPKETYQNANGVGSKTAAGFLTQYSREFLLQCSKQKVSQMTPPDWARIISQHPSIVKQSLATFDPVTYQKRWLEMEGRIASVPGIADDLDSD